MTARSPFTNFDHNLAALLDLIQDAAQLPVIFVSAQLLAGEVDILVASLDKVVCKDYRWDTKGNTDQDQFFPIFKPLIIDLRPS